MRFLVVDDSPTMRRIVINALKTFGYGEILEAEDGQEGLSKLQAEKVDFVITDWNMPDFAAADKKAPEASPAASQKPEIVNPFKLETAPDSKLARLEELVKEPVAPSKKNDSEFSIEDIIAEFKDK